jgi:hypothetical protein
VKNESAIVRRIAEKVRAAYPTCYIRKLSDRFTRGLPDLLILWSAGGRLFCLTVEVKTLTGRVSPIQHAEGDEIDRIGSDGARWIVARSPDEVLSTMQAMMSGVPT